MQDKDLEIGFTWWQTWTWLGLTIGNVVVATAFFRTMIGFSMLLIITNSILMILILRFNKYAFLIATILTFHPIVWVINGVYLKNRWNNPKVNNG